MEAWICSTCGVQYPVTEAPPAECPVCVDDRQYVNREGQQWTSQSKLRQEGHRNQLRPIEEGLTGIGTEPKVAIGQRAVLIQTSEGNILWDCISYLDEDTVQAVRDLGGIKAIAISHPHFYASMVDWAHAFDAPIYVHEYDKGWVERPDASVRFWSGDKHNLFGDCTIIRLGGHFPGSSVLHWSQAAADSKGVLFTGDTIQAIMRKNWVTFMYSYPNMLPLPASEVQRIKSAIKPWEYDRMYGGWWHTVIEETAAQHVQESADRYLAALDGAYHRSHPK